MNKTIAILLTASILATGLLVAAPIASAEIECLTTADTIHFFLKYEIGKTWSQAYNDLSTLDCPNIAYVLCVYLTHGPCAIAFEENFAFAQASLTFGEGGLGVDVEGPQQAIMGLQQGTTPPGAVLDGLLP